MEKNGRAVLLVFKSILNMLDNSMCLLWGSMMMPKTKLVVGNGILHASYSHDSAKKYSFEYFRECG